MCVSAVAEPRVCTPSPHDKTCSNITVSYLGWRNQTKETSMRNDTCAVLYTASRLSHDAGSSKPSDKVSSGSALHVKWHSDGSAQNTGFTLTVSCATGGASSAPAAPVCGARRFILQHNQSVTNLHCVDDVNHSVAANWARVSLQQPSATACNLLPPATSSSARVLVPILLGRSTVPHGMQ